MDVMNKKTVFGVLVSNRAFFNPALAIESRTQILELLDSLDYGYIIQDVDATPSKSIENYKDALLLGDIFSRNRDSIDGIIVILPTFGDEVAVVETIRRAALNVPVLVQACNDELDKVGVKSRRDAFCGKISVCNNLYQYGIPFTDTTTHTSDITGRDFRNDVIRFATLCRIVKGVRNMRVGVAGTRPAAFQTVRFSEKLLQKYGITTVPVDLSEILGDVEGITDNDPRVTAKLEEIARYGKLEANVIPANVVKQARFSVAIDRWMEENLLDASSIQCWNSLEKNFGCASCLSMSMMGEKQKPSACEADINGTVSMYILLLASSNIPALLDWNNNYEYEKNICVNTHCSNYPKSFMGQEVRIGNLDLLGETFGADRCFGAIKGHVQPGDMTYFRISTDDTRGIIKAYMGEGSFIDKPFGMDGGIAVCQIPRMQKLLKTITANGFEHHVAMVRSHVADVVYEAVSKYLGWTAYFHEQPTEDEPVLI